MNAGGNPLADYIARWDGTIWQALGTGLNAPSLGVAVTSNNDVLVGGAFTAVGDSSKAMLGFGIYHTPTGVGLPETQTVPLTLTPNPAHHTVRLTGPTSPTATLLDALGRTVRTWPLAPGEPADFDLRGLSAGLYTVRAGTAARRLVVE